MYYGNRLEYCVMNDIRAARYHRYDSIGEIVDYVCEKWKIDHIKEIREVHRAVRQEYPELIKNKGV